MKLKNDIRISIEQSIKDLHINRDNFYEVSKFEYKSIFKKTLYKFGNDAIKRHCTLSSIYMNINNKIPSWSTSLYDFTELLDILNNTLKNPNEKFYLIFNDAFDDIYLHRSLENTMLYEGYLSEIFKVLIDSSIFCDFHIVSKKFEFMISYNADGEALIFIGKDFKNTNEYIKMRNIKLYCYSDQKESICLTLTPYVNSSEVGKEYLTVYETDYNRLLILYLERYFQIDYCLDNWINKNIFQKILDDIIIDISNKPYRQQKFYNSFISWISEQLQFADGIVVDGNL